jgi:hypothetical protein
MNTQEIITQLTVLDNEYLPREALQAAIANREQITPSLLELVKQASENPQYLEKESRYMGHIYAIYLLAQFREKRALPLIIKCYSLSSKISFHSSEGVWEVLSKILASVSGGDDSLLKELVENEAMDDFLRNSAVGALVTLVACGEKSREEIIAYFQSLFRGKLKRESSPDIWTNLVAYAMDLYPEEIYADIEQAYANQLVDPLFLDLKEIDEELALGKEKVLDNLVENNRIVEDVIAEMETWACFQAKQLEIELVLEKLKFNEDRKFPRETLKEAIALRSHIIPLLLNDIKATKADAETLVDSKEFIGITYTLYLLAQFREKRAYPLIVDFFSMPGDLSMDLTGDLVFENLARILASVYNGDDTPLNNLIENADIQENVRNAALDTFVILVATGQKSRDETMVYFQSLFGKLDREMSSLWTHLVRKCAELYAEEVSEDIQKVLDEELVEYLYENPETYLKELNALGKDKVLERLQVEPLYTLIDDTINEMQDWFCFQQPKKQKKAKPRYSEPRIEPKVGRNKPCPCGSGKKYKKCCLA